MVTNCKNCGLPIFHGAAGYAGAQCRCGFSTKPNYDHNALADLLKERDTLRKQLDEARELLNDSRNKINYMRQNGEWYQPEFLLERIDDWLEANKP